MNSEGNQPEMLEAQWDRDQVNALFDDLSAGAQVEHVQVRSSARGGPNDRAVTLEEARELFDSQDAKAIQIRYRFEEDTWCDTLMVQSDTVKIIRTRLTQ